MANLLGLAVVFGALELSMHLAHLDTRNWYGCDIAYRNFYDRCLFNSMGYRDRQYDDWELANENKWIAIGDSYTFGSGIDRFQDRYTNLLAKKLHAPVINLGVPGTEVDRHMELWETEALPLNPRGVIFQFTLNDAAPFFERGRCESSPPWNLPLIGQNWGFHSFVLSILNNGYTSYLIRHNKVQSYEKWLACAYGAPDGGYPDFLTAYETFLAKVKTECPYVLLVVWPYFTSTDPYPFEAVHRDLKTVAEKAGVDFIDLTDAYQGLELKELMVNPIDPHPNEKAHAIAADRIFSQLQFKEKGVTTIRPKPYTPDQIK